jgi:putative Holliday junction resolvase
MSSQVLSLDDLAPRLSARDRLIGVDLGTKTIGLALSDVERRFASPLETIRRTKFTKDLERLAGLMAQYEIAAMVVGLPLNMDGSEGPRVQSTRAFVRQIGPIVPVPVCFWDERLSTAAVTRTLIEQDVSRAKRAEVVDRMAAAYILQGALDRLSTIERRAR